jgi:hypothetical protein
VRPVDELEVVEVEHDRRAARAVALAMGAIGFELPLEAAAIDEPGQRS